MKSVIVKDEASAMSLAKEMKNGTWVVLYYAEWCGHCSQMKPEWNKLENKHSNSNDIVVAKVEQQHLELLNNKPEIRGYPTIFKNKNNNLEEYQGERNCEGFEQFINVKSSKKGKARKSSKKSSVKGKSGKAGKAGKSGSVKGKSGKAGKSGSVKGKAGKAGKAGKSGKKGKK